MKKAWYGVLIVFLGGCAGVVNTPKPNIILIMADDLGYETLACNGGTSYRTPNLDQMAREGVRFSNGFSTPLCTPSRVQLMTGKYNFRNYTEFGSLKPGEKTFAHLLRESGYRTAVVGKWQLAGAIRGEGYQGKGTLPEEAGFDEYSLWHLTDRGSRYWDPVIRENGELRGDLAGRYGPDVLCDFAIGFIERNRHRPFLLYYPMVLTHSPFVPPPGQESEELKAGPSDPRFFAGMVEAMDRIVGQVLQRVDQLGLSESTLVLFTGDNGTHSSIVSGFQGGTIRGAKGSTTDAGTHVPLIARWTGTAPAGIVCDDLIDFTDFLPTLADVSRAEIPKGIDGHSFLPQIRGEAGHPRDWVFCHYVPRWGNFQPSRFAQDHRWRLYEGGGLFDLASDPDEEHPLEPPFHGEALRAQQKLEQVFDRMR